MSEAELELYHAYLSFYSQRARLAFAVKGLPYKSITLNLHGGDTLQPYYMRMNPKAQVPVLKHGETFVTDSSDIVDYVDALPSDKPRLVPDPSTAEGANVAYYRKLLNDLKIPVLSYGAILNRDLTDGTCLLPASFVSSKKISDGWQSMTEKVTRLAEEHPDLRDAYLSKAKDYKSLGSVLGERNQFLSALNDCDKVLDEIEMQLAKQDKKWAANQNGDKPWLCTPNFSVADIFLAVTLQRLVFVGLGAELFLRGKRPLLKAYYKRCLAFSPFHQECKYTVNRFWLFYGQIGYKYLHVIPFGLAAATVAFAVAVAYKTGYLNQ